MSIYVILKTSTKGLEKCIDAVDLGFELEPESNAATRLLPLKVDTCSVMTGAPRAGRFSTVTLDLAGLA